MKNIVFLLGSYYPNYSAVGKCLGNIADEMENDFNLTVISMKTEYKQIQNESKDKQKIIRITTKYHDKRLLNNEIIQQSSGMKRKIARFYKFYLRIIGVFRKVFSKNTINELWVKEYLTALNRIETPIDILIPTCTPFESVSAAMKYKKTHINVEIIPYLFDLFSENKNLNKFRFNKLLKEKQNMKLEIQMFDMSKKILHVSNWNAYIKRKYPQYQNKTVEVEHPLLIIKNGESSSPNCNDKKLDIEKYKLVFAGSLIRKYVEADYILKVFSELCMRQFFITFYSAGNAIIDVENSKNKNVKLVGWVSKEKLNDVYNSADGFISISEKNGRQISSKIFEYMSYGKPIIHFYFSDDDYNLTYLKEYPNALLLKADIEKLEFNRTQIMQFIKNKNHIETNKIESQILKLCTPQYIASLLKREIEN